LPVKVMKNYLSNILTMKVRATKQVKWTTKRRERISLTKRTYLTLSLKMPSKKMMMNSLILTKTTVKLSMEARMVLRARSCRR
jgi:hypothetical protein